LRNNILWVPAHFIECGDKSTPTKINKSDVQSEKEDNETLPEITKSKRRSSEVKVNNLFGSKYKDVNMFDEQLAGQVFYISSGHGGPDPGAQCTDLEHTLCEDEYAYDVALRLARDLTQHGATVHMIIQDENDGIRDDSFLDCDYDETCNGVALPVRQLDRLKQRADHINRLYNKYKKQGVKKQTAVMVHVDSRNKEQRQDVFFYHYGDDKVSKDLAYNLQSTFEEKYEIFQKGRGYKGYVANRGLYMLRKVDPAAVYIEIANIRNKSDHIRLMEKDNRQALANWMFEGLTGIK
jgi:N-acetylmuramoyl-L-alanine amidase